MRCTYCFDTAVHFQGRSFLTLALIIRRVMSVSLVYCTQVNWYH